MPLFSWNKLKVRILVDGETILNSPQYETYDEIIDWLNDLDFIFTDNWASNNVLPTVNTATFQELMGGQQNVDIIFSVNGPEVCSNCKGVPDTSGLEEPGSTSNWKDKIPKRAKSPEIESEIESEIPELPNRGEKSIGKRLQESRNYYKSLLNEQNQGSWWGDPNAVNPSSNMCVQSVNQPQSYFTGPYPTQSACEADWVNATQGNTMTVPCYDCVNGTPTVVETIGPNSSWCQSVPNGPQ